VIEYRPVEHDPQVNVSRTSPLKEFALLLGGLIAVLMVVYWALGLLVDLAVNHLSVEREQELWGTAGSLFESFVPSGEDARSTRLERQQAWVEELYGRLPAPFRERLPPYEFRLVVADDERINAVALPGGTIVVFSGLVDAVQSDNELLFVLGHELGHFAERAHLRALGRALIFTLIQIVLFGADETVGGVTAMLEAAAAVRYSQDQELAADIWGLEALIATYGHGGGAADFLSRMQRDADQSALDEWQYLLATHPYPGDRIETIEDLIKERGIPVAPVSHQDRPGSFRGNGLGSQ
jgi:Zn-dependent protease with chaperone function